MKLFELYSIYIKKCTIIVKKMSKNDKNAQYIQTIVHFCLL